MWKFPNFLGSISIFAYSKRKKMPTIEGSLSLLSFGLLFHSFGDSYLHQNKVFSK